MRENYRQMSFSEAELRRRKTGVVASTFPPSWQSPDAKPDRAMDIRHASLGNSMRNCPIWLTIIHDTRKRAPDPEGDVLGFMSLGCIMQNLWLMAEARGVGLQILTTFSGKRVESDLHRILEILAFMSVAFACRLGYPETSDDG